MENKKILIYGATGYTGKLFANHLIKSGIQPILAGRSRKVETLGKELDCSVRLFSTEDAGKHLKDVDALVNLAGPFAKTQDGLIKGCIESHTHYLDIAGEVPEVKNAHQYDEQARKAGIVILPATGFGVVPTDIAARLACEQVEMPTHLTILYATRGGASRGTLKTVLKDIQKPGVCLRNGKFEKAFPAEKAQQTMVFEKTVKGVYNPWRADLFTARHTTNVENIETYSEFPAFVVSMMKGRLTWLRNLILNKLINFLPEGPNKKQLRKGKTYIKAIAVNDRNETGTVEVEGPEAYLFTIISIQQMLQLLFASKAESGFKTPAQFGTQWISEVEGVKINTEYKT